MPRSFLRELKRRKVYRVAVAYAVVGWALVQIATQVFPFFRIPDWSVRLLVLLLLAGFPVALVLAWAFDATPHGVARTETEGQPMLRRARRGSVVVGVIGVAIAAVVGAGYWTWHRESVPITVAASAPVASSVASRSTTVVASTAPGVPIPAKSVAVLPFENLSADKNNAYFADGMQDLILTKLADIGDLKVISRTSTMKYASHPDDLKTIGKQLGVATLLEGSVQKAGKQVLINVQLIDARTDSHIWAQSYTRTLDNIFGVEGEVAQKVAAALKTKLSDAEAATLAAVPTHDQTALDLYLRAEYQSNQGLVNLDFDSWRAAISLYRQATAHDPAFALAYARMSCTESLMVWFGAGEVDVKSLKIDAHRDAARALSLAPGLAAAQVAIGYSDHFGSHDEAAAAKAFWAALSLKPNDPDAFAGLGLVEFQQGRVQASVDSFQRAFALDPRSAPRATQAGAACMWVFRYADAERLFRRARALNPRTDFANALLVWTIVYGSGDIPRALTVASDKVQQVHLLTLQRKYQAALSLLQGIPDTPDNFLSIATGKSKALQQAELYRLLGDAAKARALFEQVLAAARAQSDKRPDMLSRVAAWLDFNVAAAELGLGHASLGLDAITKMQADAARSMDRAFELLFMREAASLYAQASRADLAVPMLARALPTPGMGLWYSPAMLRIDPAWDPIRHTPEFQALLKKYGHAEFAVATSEVGHG